MSSNNLFLENDLWAQSWPITKNFKGKRKEEIRISKTKGKYKKSKREKGEMKFLITEEN